MQQPTHCTEENFLMMFDKYAGSVYGLILKFANNDIAIAEKLTAETFIAVYRQYHLYKVNYQSHFSWIYCIMLATMNNHGYKPTPYTKATDN